MTTAKTVEIPVVWPQCAICTGCSVSVLNSLNPTIKNLLIDEAIPTSGNTRDCGSIGEHNSEPVSMFDSVES
jgi:hypothetical protein